MLCQQIREWLFTIGYTLAYGALLAKLWRVYSIFNNPAPNKKVCFCIQMHYGSEWLVADVAAS